MPPHDRVRRTRKPPWRMSRRGLRRAFHGAAEAVVVRSVVLRVVEEIRAGREPEIRGNLRTLGYRYLLPVWVQVFGPHRPRWDRRLSRITRRLVMESGLLSYRELGITDISWEARRIGTERPEVLVFGEDRDLVRVMRRVHERFSVSTLITDGSPHAVTSEYTAAHIAEAMARRGRTGPLRLLSLNDYDPHGWDGARALVRHLAVFGLPGAALEMLVWPSLVPDEDLLRIAVPIVRQRPMDTVLSRWMDETDGIAGRAAKLEATSVPPEALEAAVARALEVPGG